MSREEKYFTPALPGSFTTPYGKDAAWARSYDAYTLHKQPVRKFGRRKIFVVGADHLWQLDLADLTSLASYNDNVKYLLCCVDAFSRYAFVRPLENKGAVAVRDAFASVVADTYRKPNHVQSDKGREFLNAIFQEYLRSQHILFYTTENDDIKCAIAERFIRTLKSKMWRMFTHRKSYRYVDVLQDLVASYNATHHSSIKMAPRAVTERNEQKVFDTLYAKKSPSLKKKPLLRVGDVVRVVKKRSPFEKGYYTKWTTELFIVSSIYETAPVTYGLDDYSGESIKGRYYEQELQKVENKEPSVFAVEKVLKTRTIKGKKRYLVRWAGFSPKHDSWVDDVII